MAGEFDTHLLNERGLERARAVGTILSTALDALREVCANDLKGTGAREMALVVTKMQEAGFFAKRCVALDPANNIPAAQLEFPAV